DLRSYVCGRGPAPKEDNEAVVAGEPGPNGEVQNQLPPTALAFAGVGTKASLNAQELPPRAALEPMLGWTGRDPAEAKVAAAGGLETDRREAGGPCSRARGAARRVEETGGPRRGAFRQGRREDPAQDRGLRGRQGGCRRQGQAGPQGARRRLSGRPRQPPLTA